MKALNVNGQVAQKQGGEVGGNAEISKSIKKILKNY